MVLLQKSWRKPGFKVSRHQGLKEDNRNQLKALDKLSAKYDLLISHLAPWPFDYLKPKGKNTNKEHYQYYVFGAAYEVPKKDSLYSFGNHFIIAFCRMLSQTRGTGRP